MDSLVYAACLSGIAPASSRDELDTDVFDCPRAAQQWAEEQLCDSVKCSGTAWNFQVELVRVEFHEWTTDTWAVNDETIVGRVSWDSGTGDVKWQTTGPYIWAHDECD
ncbi:hypothetical protein FG87_34665 [Nocardia vulneris]|uniref:Uncharacterized protein n=2 Tax=Nocardia vulneris TaxID=1141657 RepID=A0ABR4Z657_9NOCA|nr:hypothetical protein FG87_34665 [Nocardia vulneris]